MTEQDERDRELGRNVRALTEFPQTLHVNLCVVPRKGASVLIAPMADRDGIRSFQADTLDAAVKAALEAAKEAAR